MAVHAHIKIEEIPGPSTSKESCIDVLSFSFGASNSAVYGAGSSGSESTAGRVDISNITFMKVLDKTSPELFACCCTGKHLSKVELMYSKPVGEEQQEYFKIKMEDVLVTSIQLSGSNENPMESISLAPQQVWVCYNPESDEGSLAGFVERGYDISKAAKI